MNYWTGAAALVCLCIGIILLMASLTWFVNRRHDRLPMAYLLALVCLVVLQSLEFLYHASGWFQPFPFFLKLIDPLIVLIPFCVYGYIRALQGENVLSQTSGRWLHASPMIAVALLAIPFWSLPGEAKVHWMIQGMNSEALWQPVTLFGNPYLAVIGGLSLFYWGLQNKHGINSRKVAVKEWVGHLQRIQLVIAGSMALRITIYLIYDESFSVTYVLAPTMAYLTYLLLTHARPPAHLLRANLEPIAEPFIGGQPDVAAEHGGESSLSRALFSELCNAMEQGAFRDTALTLRKLADTCGTTTHQASAAINLCSGANFYEWVNRYRIDAANQALASTDLSVTEICYESGFNSKSTFNTAFRKINGCTPTEFRKKQENNPTGGLQTPGS